jgi:hypothetical protein
MRRGVPVPETCAVCREERLGVNAAAGQPTCGRASCLLENAETLPDWETPISDEDTGAR